MSKDTPQHEQIESGKLSIAVGRHRKDTSWKNKQIAWPDLVKRLSETHRTAETVAEYNAAKKARQDEIKDIGGFVGGYLSNGRRKAENVESRQLITLDLDFATPEVWDDFTIQHGFAACVYSTHKHTPEAPRLRFVIPLSRPVFRDEYEPISRRIAEWLGIDQFDHTTYQPERLMYWPSTSKDGVFYFQQQDGPWLNPDDVLATYKNWRDSSEWPAGSNENEIVIRELKKQGDPLEKPEYIGAFCRAFTISEAIGRFLNEFYEPCDVPNRYTFKEGSTAAGLVIYDDKFAYSHHGTDPANNGHVHNAFDLVRIHLYKDGPDSMKEMRTFAGGIEEVRAELHRAKLDEINEDFAGIDQDEEAPPLNNDWLKKLKANRAGDPAATSENVALIIENAPGLAGRLWFDEFSRRLIVKKKLPWPRTTTSPYFTGDDLQNLINYIEKRFNISGPAVIQRGLTVYYSRHSFHPVRDYLNGLIWDGSQRLETLLIDYLGAEDCEYTRAVTRKAFIAAVARIYNPGCKFDNVLTLVGPQGCGKSTLIKKMGGPYYSESFCLNQIGNKESLEQLQGVWLLEIAELAGLRKTEVEAVKHFISKTEDRYRVPYGTMSENFARQCVFFGTTNNTDFLRDPSGNRRFWPVDVAQMKPVKSVFTDLTENEVGQLFAEAVLLYKKGEALHLTPELEAIAAKVQADHSEYDERTGIIIEYLEAMVPKGWKNAARDVRSSFLSGSTETKPGELEPINEISVVEIMVDLFNYTVKDANRDAKQFHNIMRSLKGWRQTGIRERRGEYGVQRTYKRTLKKVGLSVAGAAELPATTDNTGNKKPAKSVAGVAAMLRKNECPATPETLIQQGFQKICCRCCR